MFLIIVGMATVSMASIGLTSRVLFDRIFQELRTEATSIASESLTLFNGDGVERVKNEQSLTGSVYGCR